MRRRLGIVLVFLLAVGCSRPPGTDGSKWKVIKIVDGDTIDVLDASNQSHRIRLQGIDAPEGGQAFGAASREHLNDLLLGKEVILQGDKVDKHHRRVCKVLFEGHDANLEQVNAGLAWFYRQYENELSGADRVSYFNAESAAHNAKRGLWSDPAPTPPWEYRYPDDVSSSSAQQQSAGQPSSGKGQIIGNRRSRIYHWPGCPNYDAIAPHNREYFKTREEAEKAGYRPARNCDH